MDRRSFVALPLTVRAASRTLETRLQSAIDKLDIIDTHEHFPSEASRVKTQVDFFTLVGHYAVNDLISAGLSQEAAERLRNPKIPASARWAEFEPHWKFVRSTGYGQALALAIREIYGFSEISASTLPAIDQAIASKNKSGIYREILRNRGRIRYVVNDAVVDPADGELLASSRRFDHFIDPRNMKLVEKLTSVSITSLSALEHALTDHFERAVKAERMRAIKVALAYSRDLRFDSVPPTEASAEFGAYLAGRLPQPGNRTVNYLFHHLMRLADAHAVPVQIHTGMLSSNGTELERTRPTQLINVLTMYPRVRFDLFHTGYPYHQELIVMVKQFPNAYADFCWTHIISPAAARRIMAEMLDAVPANKVFGFGGDYRYPELSYAHSLIARRNIAAVLVARVESGGSTEEEAIEIARWLLHDNAERFFAPPSSRA